MNVASELNSYRKLCRNNAVVTPRLDNRPPASDAILCCALVLLPVPAFLDLAYRPWNERDMGDIVVSVQQNYLHSIGASARVFAPYLARRGRR